MSTATDSSSPSGSRRPIAARGNVLIQRIAQALTRTSLTPNAISVLGVVFAAAGAAALVFWPIWGAILCAVCIQLLWIAHTLNEAAEGRA